ncbi:MAG: hypothetical protein GY774_30305 [Planctomycetes bacterium]|nr:hypothetical protein [Planctomycetota bacterium]
MTTVSERRLAEFVNRDNEIKAFRNILEDGDALIIAYWGGGGLGKSSLLSRMIHECAQRKLRKAEIIWTDTRNHDYLAIMRKVRDDVGLDFFNKFTDLVNYFTVPQYKLNIQVNNVQSKIEVGRNLKIEGESSVNDIAGVIIKDSMLVIPRSDMDVPESERLARLTDSFIECFAAALSSGPPLVVFFDSVEKMTLVTRKWVWGELLGGVLDGRLKNVRFVLCGREKPPQDLDRDLQLILEDVELKPLDLDHIIEYLEKRGVDKNLCEDLAMMIMGPTRGEPLRIANEVDKYLLMKKKARRNG